ncbi:MAG: MCE family protein [Gemmatimonadetes bacterium]|nr:MCE family protein [Gemmatimonadota bacterium]
MSMRTRTADALVGVLVLGAILVVVLAVVVTRGWTERRVTIFMLSPSVQDLKEDTPVYLQGLAIGEVAAISPLVDSGAMGPPEFLVALRLRERYANGVPIVLPLGTSAEIASSGLIGAASVALLVPPNQRAAALAPGDTIRAGLRQSATDALKEVADSLKTQVSDILRDTRKLLATLDRTAQSAETQLNATAPELRGTLTRMQAALDELRPAIASANALIASSDARVGTLQDSLLATLSDARQLLNDADTLTTTMTGLTRELTPDLKRTITNMYVVSAKLEHFIDAVTRRPHRLVTGVNALPRDSIVEAAP